MFRHRLRLVVVSALGVSLLACSQDKGTGPPEDSPLDSPYLLGSTNGSPSYLHTFPSPGTYRYRCRLHTGDVGMVFVTDQGPESVFVSISEGDYDPDTATVKANGRVRWQNFDEGTHHTVTSY